MYKKKLVISLLLCSALILSGCWFSNSDSKEAVNVNSAVEKTDTKPVEKWLYPAYELKDAQKKWGYMNKEGKYIIQPAYDSCEDFKANGLAIVRNKEAAGILDKTGKVILEPVYKSISYLEENLYSVNDGKTTKLIDTTGKTIFEFDGYISKFSNGLAVIDHEVNKKYEYGYINTEGKVVIEMQYSYADSFDGDKALVKTKEGKNIIINKNGETLTTLNYNNVRDLSDGSILYQVNNKYGYLKDDGSVLIEAKYVSAESFSGGYAIVNNSDKAYNSSFGVINKNGEFVIKPQYSGVWQVDDNIFAVSEKAISRVISWSGPMTLISPDGNKLTDNKYYDMYKFSGEYLSVTDENSTFFINKSGEIAKDLPKVEGIGTVEILGDLVKAKVDGELLYLTKEGKKVWQSDDTYSLKDGITIKSIKYRPDRATLINYPQLSGLANTQVQSNINSTLKDKFIGNSSKYEKHEDTYDADLDGNFNINKNKDLLIVEYSSYYFPYGAAHGMPSQIYYHIDLNTGNFYSLSDLFKKDSNYTKRLSDIVGNQITQKSRDKSLMIFPDSYKGIRADHNFVITKDALQVYFTPYEIAAYAAGFVSFDIPYNEISGIIDTEGAFWKSFDKNVAETKSQPGTNSNPDLMGTEINNTIKNYETNLIESINKNDFTIVKPYLVKDSNLYKAQMDLVTNLNKQGIKEKLMDFSVKDVKQQGNSSQVKVYVDENIAIQYPGKDFATKQFSYIYTLVKTEGGTDYKLSDIEKWDK